MNALAEHRFARIDELTGSVNRQCDGTTFLYPQEHGIGITLDTVDARQFNTFMERCLDRIEA